MKWEEVRNAYPNTYVLLKEIKSHVLENKKFIDEVAVVRTIGDPREATKEFMKAKGPDFVYHTGNSELVMEIITRPGIKGILS